MWALIAVIQYALWFKDSSSLPHFMRQGTVVQPIHQRSELSDLKMAPSTELKSGQQVTHNRGRKLALRLGTHLMVG